MKRAVGVRGRTLLCAAGLAALVLAAYEPYRQCGFIWDDDKYVSENPTLVAPDGLKRIWTAPRDSPQYYPLVFTSFWLEYRLWADSPLGYHVVNVLLHAASAIVLWRILLRVGLSGAWLAAAIFAAHPVHVESVAWITERKNVLSGFFYLSAGWAYLRFSPVDADRRGPGRFYALSLLLFAGALLSKTVTGSLPAALLIVRWWKRGRLGWGDVWPVLPMIPMALAMGGITAWLEREHVGAIGGDWDHSFVERCLIAGRALWFYLSKLVWPWPIIFFYPRWKIDATAWAQYLFPIGAVALLALLLAGVRRWGRGPLAACLFFGITLFPALGFANVYPMRYSFVADHFQYLASIGPIALFSAMGAALFGSAGASTSRVWPSRVGYLMPVILLAGYGMIVREQAGMYRDPESLWRTTLARNDGAFIAHNNLGWLLEGRGELKEAESYYMRSLELNAEFTEAQLNLGNVYMKTGRPREAVDRYRKSIETSPKFSYAYYGLGLALSRTGRSAESIEPFRKAVELKPDYGEAYYQLAQALVGLGRKEEAVMEYARAIRASPHLDDARMGLAQLLEELGRWEQSARLYQAYLRNHAGDERAHLGASRVLTRLGKETEALDHLDVAMRTSPASVEGRVTLARSLMHHGRLDAALGHLQTAASFAPQNAAIRVQTGEIWMLKKDYERAGSEFRDALQMDPNNAEARERLASLYAAEGRIDAAIEQLRALLEQQPDSATGHNNLAAALVAKGDLVAALEHLKKAVSLLPEYLDARMNLARLLGRQGDRQGAVREYREVLRLSPGHAAAKSELERMEQDGSAGASPSQASPSSAMPPRSATSGPGLDGAARGGE